MLKFPAGGRTVFFPKVRTVTANLMKKLQTYVQIKRHKPSRKACLEYALWSSTNRKNGDTCWTSCTSKYWWSKKSKNCSFYTPFSPHIFALLYNTEEWFACAWNSKRIAFMTALLFLLFTTSFNQRQQRPKYSSKIKEEDADSLAFSFQSKKCRLSQVSYHVDVVREVW